MGESITFLYVFGAKSLHYLKLCSDCSVVKCLNSCHQIIQNKNTFSASCIQGSNLKWTSRQFFLCL